MKCPAEVYTSSCRPYQSIPEPHYPFHDRTVNVTSCGPHLPLSEEDQSQQISREPGCGHKEVDDGIWLVSWHL